MSSFVQGDVPRAWTTMIAQLRTARLSRDVMRDPRETQAARDRATVDYSRAVDAMVDDLALLSDGQMLGRITLLLSKKDRA